MARLSKSVGETFGSSARFQQQRAQVLQALEAAAPRRPVMPPIDFDGLVDLEPIGPGRHVELLEELVDLSERQTLAIEALAGAQALSLTGQTEDRLHQRRTARATFVMALLATVLPLLLAGAGQLSVSAAVRSSLAVLVVGFAVWWDWGPVRRLSHHLRRQR